MAGRSKEETGDITLLGNQNTKYSSDYAPEVLETFPNKHPGRDYFVKFNCPEFTSLCPITGQPDFATLYISYVPREIMVESKSLKLYLFSFRNHGDFHEDCVNIIMNDLIQLMEPAYIEVWGKFLPRGGISIDPYCNYGRPGTKWEQVAWDRLTHHSALEKITTTNNGVRRCRIFLSCRTGRFFVLCYCDKKFFWNFAQFFLQSIRKYGIIKMFFSDSVGICRKKVHFAAFIIRRSAHISAEK